jgi:ABC-2 type transport system permease protein
MSATPPSGAPDAVVRPTDTSAPQHHPDSPVSPADRAAPGTRRRAFLAILGRDLWVTFRHEPASFLAQALLQPFFFLFIFGRVLPEIGAAQGDYGELLLPGIMALTAITVSLQNVALPLVIDFSFTKEIEDRLLAPLPVWAVAIEKMIHAALRGVVATVLLLPLAALILPGGLGFGEAQPIALAAVILGGAFAGAALGLVMGTVVPPNRINIMFAVVLTPLLFTGATFYPWASLESLQWFQILTLLNPLTYVSEGSRAALGAGEHLATWAIPVGIVGSIVVFGAIGLRGFQRRAVD